MPPCSETRPSQLDRETVFDTLYAAHAATVLRHAERLVGPTEAPDVAQIVWLQVAGAFETFRGDSQVSTWLHVVTRNVVATLRRTDKAKAARAWLPLTLAAGTPATTPDPEALAMAGERQRRLDAAVRTLRAEQQAVVLAELLELSIAERATLFGVPRGTVKSRIWRAREALRARLRATLAPETLRPTRARRARPAEPTPVRRRLHESRDL